MEIQVRIDNLQNANLFLRALWAEFRKECGKCAWQYTPYRDGQKKKIFLGFADINRPEGAVEIRVTYTTRGSIRSIAFDHKEDQPVSSNSELGILIQRAVESALKNMGSAGRRFYSVKVEGLYMPPGYYLGDSFAVTPISKRRFELKMAVHAFDESDAPPEFVSKMRQVLNILSVETNSAFWPVLSGQVEEDEHLPHPLDEEFFVDDSDWIDGCPTQHGQILISREGKKLIELVVGREQLANDADTFLRACGHFHTARKYAAQVLDLIELGEPEQVGANEFSMPIRIRNRRLETAGQMGDAHAEITGALYMSAMEVAAKIGQPQAETCEKCGQIKYKIAERVTDLMKSCGGEHLARTAKGYYNQRSKYLHEGSMLSLSNYTGTSIPQLDPSSPTGCHKQITSPDPNLRDYVGLCLRKVLKAVVAGI